MASLSHYEIILVSPNLFWQHNYTFAFFLSKENAQVIEILAQRQWGAFWPAWPILWGLITWRCKQLFDQGIPKSGIISCMRPANERRRYIVTSSLIGWAHTEIIFANYYSFSTNRVNMPPVDKELTWETQLLSQKANVWGWLIYNMSNTEMKMSIISMKFFITGCSRISQKDNF